MLISVEHESECICDALGCQEEALDLDQDKRGAVHMFGRSFFPWKGLPYPLQHAKLALLLQERGQGEIAAKMAEWQQATLDHASRPLHTLFLQEKRASYEQLVEANRAFFAQIGHAPDLENPYVHEDLGFVNYKLTDATVMSVGSGCKSGMGAFLSNAGGIINYGPQLSEMWETHSFGLAGRAERFAFERKGAGFELSYRTRLAAPHPRETGVAFLQDSGFAGIWMDVAQAFEGQALTTQASFKGIYPMEGMTFALFAQGDVCAVAGSHKLAPKSLDRYEGPPQVIEVGGIGIDGMEGFHHMEVIPLAGDESFWGADFLISLKMRQSKSVQLTFLN